MPEIDICGGTITTPLGNIGIRRFSHAVRQNVIPASKFGDPDCQRRFMKGSIYHVGSFTGLAETGFKANQSMQGTITITIESGNVMIFDALLTVVQAQGDKDVAGGYQVSGQWIGTQTNLSSSSAA